MLTLSFLKSVCCVSFWNFAFHFYFTNSKWCFSAHASVSDHILAFTGVSGASSLHTLTGAVQTSQFGCGALQRNTTLALLPLAAWQQTRHGSFFNKRMYRKRRLLNNNFLRYNCLTGVFTVTAEELWRGVLAETGAGARKGRGKRTKRKLKKDLNRGQRIGEGHTSYVLFLSCLC